MPNTTTTTTEEETFDSAWEAFEASKVEETKTETETASAESTPDSEQPPAGDKVEVEVENESEGEAEHKAPPYHRFAEVARERTAFKAERDALRVELDALRAASAEPKKPAQETEDDEVDRILREIESDSTDPKIAALETRVRGLEQEKARIAFDEEAAAALGKYPGVDRRALVDRAIVTEGKVPIMDLAKELATGIDATRASAVAEFLDQHPNLKAAYLTKEESKPPAPNIKGKGTTRTQQPDVIAPKKGETDASYIGRLMDYAAL